MSELDLELAVGTMLEIWRGVLPLGAPPAVTPEVVSVWARILGRAGVGPEDVPALTETLASRSERYPVPRDVLAAWGDRTMMATLTHMAIGQGGEAYVGTEEGVADLMGRGHKPLILDKEAGCWTVAPPPLPPLKRMP